MFFTKETMRTNVAYAAYSSKNHEVKDYKKCLYAHLVQQNKCLNAHLVQQDDALHLPVYKIDTKEEFNQFKSTIGDIFALDADYNEVPSFNEATANYDDLFFADNTLILSYITSGSGSYRYGVYDIDFDPSSFCMYVTNINRPIFLTGNIESWFILVEMRDEDIRNCKSFDAQHIKNPELP